MLLWDFAHNMREHQNSVLHDTKLKASHAMHEAKINDAITNLYEKVDTYSARIGGTLMFCWLFDCIIHYGQGNNG
jgi:hypothetical protein